MAADTGHCFPLHKQLIIIIKRKSSFPSSSHLFFSMEKQQLSAINFHMDALVSKACRSNCLVGKILLHRPLSVDNVNFFTQTEWRCEKCVQVSPISRNVFLFIFEDQEDLERAFMNRPWLIMGGLLLLSLCSANVPSVLNFCYAPFWVQAHGLPLNYLTTENGAKIGDILGVFFHTDGQIHQGRISSQGFLRLKVILDVRRPLMVGSWVKRDGSSEIWIDFKYEKLGMFCYKCGRIGNNFMTCIYPTGDRIFGPWLRAKSESVIDRDDGSIFSTSLSQPKSEASLVLHTSEEIEETQENESIPESYSDQPEPSSVNLPWRLILHMVDSLLMLANSVIIFSCVNVEQVNNRNLLILMTTHLVHLWRKLGSVMRRAFLRLRGELTIMESNEDKDNISRQIFISMMFLVMLVLGCL